MSLDPITEERLLAELVEEDEALKDARDREDREREYEGREWTRDAR